MVLVKDMQLLHINASAHMAAGSKHMVTTLPSEAAVQHLTSSTEQKEKGNKVRHARSGSLRLASRAPATLGSRVSCM
jgi:hypothetical protein